MKVLKQKGYEVVCIAPYDDAVLKIEKEFKIIVLRHFDRKSLNPFKDLKAITELYRVYKAIKPDLVFHYTIKPNIYGSLVSRMLNMNCCNVITGLTYSFLCENSFNNLGKFIYRFILGTGKKSVFQNVDDLGICLNEKIVANERAVMIKSSGVNTDHFSPDYCREHVNYKKGTAFLFVARILWDKGVGEFIEACRIVKTHFPDIECWMVGAIDEGKKSAVTRDEIQGWEKEGVVRYMGVVDDVRPLLCKSDVVVLPSYREGTPRSMLEAMAMGRPIITTDTAGCKQTVEEGINGFLVPVKDSVALAEAMLKCITMREEHRNRMGAFGRQKVLREFDERIVIDGYLRLIGELLQTGTKPACICSQA